MLEPVVAVTEAVNDGGTFMLEWISERVGNWIFHCHVGIHMSVDQRLDRMPWSLEASLAPGAGTGTPDPARPGSARRHRVHSAGLPGIRTNEPAHAAHETAGLILGITVHSRAGATPAEPAAPSRTLRLYAQVRDRVFGEDPVAGHVPAGIAASAASDAGHRSIEHFSGIVRGGSVRRTRSSPITWGQRVPPLRGDSVSPPMEVQVQARLRMLATQDEDRCRALAARLARNGTWHIPTLVATRGYAYMRELAAAGDPW